MNRIDRIIKESIDSVIESAKRDSYIAWINAVRDMSKDNAIKGNFRCPRDIRDYEEYLRNRRDNTYFPGQDEDI